MVELVRGDHLIVARVAWSDAGRSGLRSEARLPVEDIMSAEQARSLRLIASNGVFQDRRRRPRAIHSDPGQRGRALEFLGIVAIAAVLAAGMSAMVEHALNGPLARIGAVLGG